MKIMIILLIFVFPVFFFPLFSCSVFSISDDSLSFAAGNKDWHNLSTRILSIPNDGEKYGRVYFGYQIPQGFQNVSGINEHGLWYEGAALPERGDIQNHFNKPEISGELCEKALEECTSVDEVVQIYSTYFTQHWDGHSMWADKFGNSVVIEFGETDVEFIYPQNNFHVMTNFYLQDPSMYIWYNTYRFDLAYLMLQEIEKINYSNLADILEAVHQEGTEPTLFSNVYNLKNNFIYIYNFHNYDEYVFIEADKLMATDNYQELAALFNNMKAVFPSDFELVCANEPLTFRWLGDAEDYNIYISDNEDFSGCDPINIRSRNWLSTLACCSGFFFFGISAIAFYKNHYMSFLIIFILVSCEAEFISSPYQTSSLEHEFTLQNLQPNTVYFWKVEALTDNEISSFTTTQNFIALEE